MSVNLAKPIIGVDIDDTISRSVPVVIEFSNKTWGTSLTADDYSEDWAKMWGVDFEEVGRRSIQYFVSGALRDYRPMPYARKTLIKLQENYDLVCITARNSYTKDDTYYWIDSQYGDVFQKNNIHFTGAWDKIDEHSVHHTKGRICKKLGIDILIDDQLKHCLSAAEFGITSLLFGDYNWNRADVLPSNVIRVRNWTEVLEYLNDRS